MPDADERDLAAPRARRTAWSDAPAARALRALLDGLADHRASEPELLYRDLVTLLLRLVFMRLAGDPLLTSQARPTWLALRAACDRRHTELGATLFDPQCHPRLTRLQVDDHALVGALVASAGLPSLGAAHEALMALQLGRTADGRVQVQVSDRRRRSGAHYTPAALAQPLVAAALRPWLASLGDDPTPAQLLDLRICDPAMGCGAFLQLASDHLTRLLLRAWAAHGSPAVAELATHARRLIAVSCLYGVDCDPLAVELARLSAWLQVADPVLPLATLHHTLRHGDSLVGLGPTQLAAHRVTDVSHADAVIAALFAGKTTAPRERALPACPGQGSMLTARDPPLLPFHWSLAFPEVFTRPRPGFDAMIGNPPFFWGNRIGRCFGDDYRDWLKYLHPGAHGNSDLAAHFLRRAFDLLRPGGDLGFITTNSISEAETRRAGLDAIVARGGVLFEAHRDLPWPRDASVRVAVVCVHRGPLAGPHRLDGRPVAEIGSDLRPLRGDAAPQPLSARTGLSFKGVDFGGAGFLLSAAARDALLQVAPDESAHIWPVLNACGLTRDPAFAPTGFIINLGGLSLDEAAARAPHCLEHLRRHVLPRRSRARRSGRRARWWLYNEACPGLYRAIAGLERVLVGPVVASHLVFAFVAPAIVFTNALNVFALADPGSLAVLQSRVHALWAHRHGSSLRTDLRYNPSTCFETFPFPPAHPALASAGQAYDEHRAALMRRRNEGLTNVYNRFHEPTERSPDVQRLRETHAELDQAVFTAHGWDDLRPVCEFLRDPADSRSRWRLRWPQALADEVLARLLAAGRDASAAPLTRPPSRTASRDRAS